jgi:hypothetical protein
LRKFKINRYKLFLFLLMYSINKINHKNKLEVV